MQNKPANWVTGFKRSPRAANVQNRDMGLFLNSSGKFEPIDDAWDSIHSGGIFISGDNKLYFRDETNKDIYINSPADNQITIGATSGVGINTTPSATYGTFTVAGTGIHINDDGNAKLEIGRYSSGIANSYIKLGANSDSLKFTNAADSADLVTIENAGNVGIGATPGTLLELFGTAPYLTLRNSTHEDGDGGRESKIIFEGEQSGGEDSTLAVIQASHDGTSDDQKGDLIFYTNDGNDNAAPTEAVRIDSAGNVGIGTTAPDFGLQVGTRDNANNGIRITNAGSVSNKSVLGFGGSVTEPIASLGGVVENASVYTAGGLYFSTRSSTSDTAPTERMRIDQDGNVGIGAAPGTLLELNGTAPYLTIKNSTHEDGDGGREGRIIFEGEQSGGEISTLAQIQASHDGTSDDQKGDLIFYTNDGSDGASPTERMRVDSAGKVGIASTAPGAWFDGADNLVIGAADGNYGMTITSSTTGAGRIFFADGTSGGAEYAAFVSYDHNGTTLQLGAEGGGASAFTVHGSDGDCEVVRGNFVIGTAGKGIDFSAQTATSASGATTTAELLDHYEEGTWTATFAASTSGTITINTSYDTGMYTRVGRMVHVQGYFVTSAVSSPVGHWRILGLPFLPVAGPEDSDYPVPCFRVSGLGSSVNAVQGYTHHGANYITAEEFTGTAAAAMADKVDGSTEILVSLTYPV
jgi:hypothetical protein